MKVKNNQAKELVVDIETAPILANVWGIWQQNVGLNQIDRDWYILSFSAKWVGDKEIHYHDQSTAKDIEDDTQLLKKLYKLLDQADVVIAHNGRRFDIPKINTRFMMKGVGIPSPYKIVDTLDIVKRNFSFTSNKLEFLTGVLCNKKKLKHQSFPGFDLWKQCLLGNPKAWEEMKRYNIRDVVSLEELYLKLRPWNKTQPNAGVYDPTNTDKCCSKCGSNNIIKRGVAVTNVSMFQRYKCKDCGGWFRDRTNMLSADKRSNLLTNIM